MSDPNVQQYFQLGAAYLSKIIIIMIMICYDQSSSEVQVSNFQLVNSDLRKPRRPAKIAG